MTENAANSLSELTSALASGSPEAYRELVQTMSEPLMRYAMSLTGEFSAAQDAVQDSFLRLYRARKRLGGVTELRGYLFRIVRNSVRSGQRSANRRRDHEKEAADMFEQTSQPDDATLAREAWEHLTRLPAEFREVLELRFGHGLSRGEVAVALELPEGTVATRQRAGLQKLRDTLALSAAPTVTGSELAQLLGTGANMAIPTISSSKSPLLVSAIEETIMSGIRSMRVKTAGMVATAVLVALLVLVGGGVAVVSAMHEPNAEQEQIAQDGDEGRAGEVMAPTNNPTTRGNDDVDLPTTDAGEGSGVDGVNATSGTGAGDGATPDAQPEDASDPVKPDVQPVVEGQPTPTAKGEAPLFLSDPVTCIRVGETYEYHIRAGGNPAPEVAAEGLPRWMTLEGNLLSGAPERADMGTTGRITLTASNGVEPKAVQFFEVVILAAPVFKSVPEDSIIVGDDYVYEIDVEASPAATITMTAGPEWLTLEGETLSGKPGKEDAGDHPVTLTAANGAEPDAKQTFTISVNSPPEFTSTPIITAIEGEPYAYEIKVKGNPAPKLTAEGLPTWLTLSDNTLSGTPDSDIAPGSITLTASNGIEPDASQTFTITVEGISKVFGDEAGEMTADAETAKGYFEDGIKMTYAIHNKWEGAMDSENWARNVIAISDADDKRLEVSTLIYDCNKKGTKQGPEMRGTHEFAWDDVPMAAYYRFTVAPAEAKDAADAQREKQQREWQDATIEVDGKQHEAWKLDLKEGDWKGVLGSAFAGDFEYYVLKDKPEEEVRIGRDKYTCNLWTFVTVSPDSKAVTKAWVMKHRSGLLAKWTVETDYGEMGSDTTTVELIDFDEPRKLRKKIKELEKEED